MALYPFRLQRWHIGALISALCFIVFLPALNNEFVNWDDPLFVTQNTHIMQMDYDFFRWIFTNRETQWTPLRWISHAIDYQLWGLDPLGHHLSSLILHALNTFLVIVLITQLFEIVYDKAPPPLQEKARSRTRALIAGAATGILFGLHPLRVESVVWISERKDVLYAFFYLLGIICYLSYAVSAPNKKKNVFYLLCFFCFALSVMSKALAVLLPVILLLLDIYPLQRIQTPADLMPWKKVLLEKVPFFIISVAAVMINVGIHEEIGHIVPLEAYPVAVRIPVEFMAVFFYLLKMVWPLHLSLIYPYPQNVSFFQPEYIGSIILFVAITILCVFLWRRKKKIWLIVWAYFIIMILPVLVTKVFTGFAHDRYTYLSCIGPSLLMGAGISFLWSKNNRRTAAIGSIILVTVLFSFLTVRQIRVWKNSVTLWTNQIEKYPRYFPGYIYLAQTYLELLDFQKAKNFYNISLQIATDQKNRAYLLIALYRLAFLNLQLEQKPEALGNIQAFEKESRNDYKLNILKGYYCYINGDMKTALSFYHHVLTGGEDIDMFERTTLYTLMGDAYRSANMTVQALDAYDNALHLKISSPGAYYGIAKVYMLKGDFITAEKYLAIVLKMDPNNFKALTDMANTLFIQEDPDRALPFVQKAVALNPPFFHPYLVLATVLIAKGEEREAEIYISKARQFNVPEYMVLFNKSGAYSFRGDRQREKQYLNQLLRMENVPQHIRENARRMLSST